MRLEPRDVARPQVDRRLPLGDPLGDGPADPAGVGDPDRLGGPEPSHLRRLAQDRHRVRREQEHAVDLPAEPCAAQRRQQLARGYHRGPERAR